MAKSTLKVPQQRGKKSSTSRRGLLRPKTSLSFQVKVPPITIDTPGVELDVSPDSSVARLEQRIHLLTLILRRNKNQHRTQAFFKHLCLLRKALGRLSATVIGLATISEFQATTVDEIREKFEREAHLRGRKEVIEDHIREVLVPQCYVSSSAVVADKQFANLGIVLIALLAEISAGHQGVGLAQVPQSVLDVTDEDNTRVGRDAVRESVELRLRGSLLGMSTRMTGEDRGEIVERRFDSEPDVGVGDDLAITSQAKLVDYQGNHDSQNTDKWQEQHSNDLARDPEKAEPTLQLERAMLSGSVNGEKNSKSGGSGKDSLKQKKLKKKTKKSAIDDLFSGLL